MKATILTIDDEANIRSGLADNFELDGYEVKQASSGKEGLSLIAKGGIDLVITDLRMDGISGQEVVRRVTTENPGIPIIVLTGHGSIDDATKAIKMGAYDFLTKPLDLDHLNKIVKNALSSRELSIQKNQLQQELDIAREQLKSHVENPDFIGKSPEMRRVMEIVGKVAPSRASVLITGESGVGKEVVADTIHKNSPRKDKPFIKVNCAALSESLLESELFGHEAGAYTGADKMQKGRFELADGGTIFLDEIGEVSQSVQVKLLRVIQNRQFERVGGEKTLDVDVRIIAATNRNLEEEVKAGRFRQDLYYRLNVVNIQIPPLRERKDDIPLLMNSFLVKYCEENGKSIKGFDSESKTAFYNYSWPGNIRELQNFIESAVVMCGGDEIHIEDLPPSLTRSANGDSISIPLGASMQEAEKMIAMQTLAACSGDFDKASQMLGIEQKILKNILEGQ